MRRDQDDAIQPQVLIVDDVPANLSVLRDALEPEGYNILGASHGKAALRIAAGALPDLILLDVLMPGMDGHEVCRQLRRNEATRHIPVIFITVRDDKESILEGFRAGGVDYITKPYEKEEVLLRVKTHIEISRLTQLLSQKNVDLEQQAAQLASANRQLQQANRQLQQEMARRQQAEEAHKRADQAFQKADEHLSLISQQEASRWGIAGFVGRSKTIGSILDDVRKLQDAENTTVLITGESGTGKELIARAIHFGGTRAKGPFIPVNCSAIPRELAESAFFGHVRGAFTGAHTGRKGYFELADGGTLFLDEIGDMSLDLQAKLLRAIETGCVLPLGNTHEKRINVRILASTNQDLAGRIAEDRFREDLYFRLTGFIVTVPPLRGRKEDIPLLAEHFLEMFAAEMGKEAVLGREALSALEAYDFPGNIRELKNMIEHALIKSDGGIIRPEHLPFMDVHHVPGTDEVPPKSEHGERWADFEKRKALVIQRARKPDMVNGEESVQEAMSTVRTDEERILAYVEEQGSISNAECRALLSVNLHHASYILNKLHQYGLLEREGERRWTRYHLHR